MYDVFVNVNVNVCCSPHYIMNFCVRSLLYNDNLSPHIKCAKIPASVEWTVGFCDTDVVKVKW